MKVLFENEGLRFSLPNDFKEESQYGTTPTYWGFLGSSKPRVACQNLLPPKRRIAGRYGVKMETF